MIAPLRLYLATLLSLLLATLLGKSGFSLYHHATLGLSPGETLSALAWGWRFDLALSAALALPLYLLNGVVARLIRCPLARPLPWLLLPVVAGLLLLHGGDTLYYNEAGRHLGYELHEALNSGGELALTALASYPLPALGTLALLLPLLWLMKRLLVALCGEPATACGWRRLAPELWLLPLLLVTVLMVRGGVQSAPLEPLLAQEIGNSRQATVALNGAYNALFSSLTPYSVQRVLSTPASTEDLALLRDLYATPLPAPHGAARPLNILLVFLESWSAPYMASYGYDKPTTPFFDALRERSLTSDTMYAGGHRTTEGMFSTLCSAQNPLGATVAQTQLQNYPYRCLPALLREQGYQTAFFQGTNKNTSGVGTFAQLLGFEQSYGRRDISNSRYEWNSWGAHDADIYGTALDYIRQQQGPWLIGINTNTTHDSHLPPEVTPAFGEQMRYLSTLHFADQALAELVGTLEREGRMADTLLVLMADHGGPPSKVIAERYAIPFLIYSPQHQPPQRIAGAVSQRDVAPTLQRLLNLAPSPWFSGYPLTDGDAPRFADYYHAGILGWSEGESAIEFPLRSPERVTCTDSQSGKPMPCTAGHAPLVTRALAFSRLSQQLLFEGRTGDLATLRR